MGDAFSSQPQSRHGRFDDVIHKVAEAISEDRDLRNLGVELGLSNSVISRAITKNWVNGPKTTNGNNWMLRKWANTIRRSENLLPALRAALDRAGLTEIAETCHSSGIAGQGKNDPGAQSARNLNTKSDAHGMTMPDGVRNLRDRLKARYRRNYSEVKTSSIDADSLKWLQNIFVSLVLILKSSLSEDEKTGRKISIEDIYKLIEKETEKGYTTRVALIGEVGVGKTTLFSKIALDWATGKCLQDIDLLFYEPFQEMEDTQSFGNLVRNIFPDITQSEGEQIETYIQANQRKAAILTDDIDETKMNFLAKNPSNAVVSIVRGDKFQDTPVLIGMRPIIVDLIKTDDSIRQLYTGIQVEGFTKQGTQKYVEQFFEEDRDSAASLIQFIECNNVASELMAPFPVFCSLLCNIWKAKDLRETFKQLKTISQLLKRVCFFLREAYSSKRSMSDSDYTCLMKKAGDSVNKIARLAFEGLMKNETKFDCSDELTRTHREAAETSHKIGILSKEKKLASLETRLKQERQYTDAFRFPHKLLQEYIASLHLAFLFESSPSQFNEILEDALLVDLEKYRYLLFFTASKGGKVGKFVMEALCQQVNDVSFIMEVAFECHDKAALDPVKELLMHQKSVASDFSTEHILAAHVYALETYGKLVIEEVKHRPTEGTSESTKLQSDGPSKYARALCHMPKLRSLELANNYLQNEIFFSAMATEAKKSQLVKLRHKGGSVDPIASPEYAKAIVSMPKLQNLELCDVKLSDNFYPKIVEGSSTSRIMTLKHEGGSLGPTASSQYAKAIVSLPHLQNLELNGVELSDEFYQPLASKASKSQVY